jgi:phenylpropionate dioxygenase-like ring-hydroxylating dioxygenase large terminal subunit
MSATHFTPPGTEIYWDPEIYAREMNVVFGSAWLFVGHDSMIPEPGDFISNYMGDDPVILVRDRTGAPRVYLNRCRHRGNKVCLHDSGETKVFRCAYHGWTYGIGGELAAVPLLDKAYDADFPRAELGLVSPPRVATYNGLIFATWSEAGQSLEAFLGDDLRWYLETFAFDDPGGLEVLPGRHRYMVPANWKLLAENFGGDMYHFASTHASLVMLARGAQADRIRSGGDARSSETTYRSLEFTGNGQPPHGLLQLAFGDGAHQGDLQQAKALSHDAEEWVRERYERRKRLVAGRTSKPLGFHTGNIWPNLSLNGFGTAIYARTLVQWQPRSPESTDAWQWAFVDKSAPPEVKEHMAFVLTQRQSAAGMVAPDDIDNYQRMRDVLHTAHAGKLAFNYDLGGADVASLMPDLPGTVMDPMTERYHRSFYRYWQALMEHGT